jgi:glycosyltransferase involved in cell wall biosynthesis
MGQNETEISDSLKRWFSGSDKLSSQNNFDRLVEKFGFDEVFGELNRKYSTGVNQILGKIMSSECIKVPARTVKCIGFYASNLPAEGLGRVLAPIMCALSEKGYSVIFISDNPPQSQDYKLPNTIVRVALRDYYTDRSNITLRHGLAFRKIVPQFGIDLVVHNPIYDHQIFFDILAMRELGVPVVINAHTTFSKFINEGDFRHFVEQTCSFQLANGIVCLSELDLAWYKLLLGSNVVQITNPIEPLSFFPIEKPRRYDSNTILGVGKFVDTNRPLDVVYIFQAIKESIPDATLIMAGDFTDNDLYLELRDRFKHFNLEDSIEFVGSTEDLTELYLKSRVLLSTSETEGDSTAINDAIKFGIPVVMYDLSDPGFLQNVPMNRRGILTTKQPHHIYPYKSREQLANSVIRILSDQVLWDELHENQLETYKILRTHNVSETWIRLISEVSKQPNPTLSEQALMIQILLNDLLKGSNRSSLDAVENSSEVELQDLLRSTEWQLNSHLNSLSNFRLRKK